MYLHVGNQKNIRTRDIIGIFDTDSSTVSATTRKFLSSADKKGNVEAAKNEIPKSFILYSPKRSKKIKKSKKIKACDSNIGAEGKICFSQLSVSALKNRI